MPVDDTAKLVKVETRSRTPSSASSLSLKPPRTPRFAEATAVNSPLEPSQDHQNFSSRDMTTHYSPQPQVSDMGFGYIDDNATNRHASYPAVPMDDGPKSPLKSAMRVPGTPGRRIENPLSPTFKEEQVLEKQEAKTDKAQVADLVSSLLWCIFGCSEPPAALRGPLRGASCPATDSSPHRLES